MYRILLACFFLLLASGCSVQLTESESSQQQQVDRILESALNDVDAFSGVVPQGDEVLDLAVGGEVEALDDTEYVYEDDGGVRMYCDEEEKSADWCIDGFIKYRKAIDSDCWSSYCKPRPRALEAASGSVETLSGGVRLAQPDVKLALTLDDLDDVNLSVLTIDQIEEFGRIRLGTNLGNMDFQLFPTRRPGTVRAFVKLADGGYLQDLDIYRLIPDFLFQFGGGFETEVDPEIDFSFGDVSVDGLSNTYGTLAFAGLDFITFFVNVDDNMELDEQYVPFGQLVKGHDVLEKLLLSGTDISDSPVDQLVVSTVEIDEVYQEYLQRVIEE